MANNTANVTYGKPNKAGAVFTAPLGTTLPTDATTALGSGFTGLGYVSEDGLTNSYSRDIEDVKAWGGDTVLTLETDMTDEWSFSLLESLNSDVLEVFYGEDNVTVSNGEISIKVNSDQKANRVWVFDMSLAGGGKKRIVLPNAVITETEDIPYKDDEAVIYGFTLKALPDANGNTHYEYISAGE